MAELFLSRLLQRQINMPYRFNLFERLLRLAGDRSVRTIDHRAQRADRRARAAAYFSGSSGILVADSRRY